MAAVQTPLLTALRARRKAATGLSAESGGWTRAAVLILAAMIPVAVCIYLATLEPLASIKSVEFTEPDAVVIGLVAVVLLRSLVKGFYWLPKELSRPLTFFFIASCLSAAFASDKLRAFAAIVQMGEFVALAWAISLIGSVRRALWIIYFVLGIFVFQSIFAMVQFAADDPIPRGTFYTNQKYSMFMGAGAAMSFALFAAEKSPSKKLLYFLCMIVLLGGALLGEERAPWLAFMISAIAILWFAGKARKKLAVGFLATVCLFVAVVATVPELRDRTVSRLEEVQIQGEKKNTLLSRLAVWGVAFSLFREHPILGVGPKNFVSLVPSLLTSDEMGGLEAAESHNVWIGILAEGGLLGFLTYLYLCYSILHLCTRYLRSLPDGGLRNLHFAYAAYNFFWLAMSYHYFTKGEGHIHFLMIGLLLGVQRTMSENTPESQYFLTSAGRKL